MAQTRNITMWDVTNHMLVTPRDISKWVLKKLSTLGLPRHLKHDFNVAHNYGTIPKSNRRSKIS